MKVFVVSPRLPDDSFTKITAAWGEQLFEWLSKFEKLTVAPFLAEDAFRHNVESTLREEEGKSGLFIFIDHGDRNTLAGSDSGKIIDSENIHLLKNKFIYAIACRAGGMLGHEALVQGAAGYIGFNHNVYISSSGAASIFGKCLLAGLKGIIMEQVTAAQARMLVIQKTEYYINRLNENTDIPHGMKIALITALKHNMDFMIHLGAPDWRPVFH